MNAPSSVLYVIDNTVLSNFAQIRRPELLQLAVHSQGITTTAVRQELAVGETNQTVPQCEWRWLPVVELTEAEQEVARRLLQNLDRGESECLAVAMARAGKLATDDRAARQQAAKRGIPLVGTVGMLKILIDTGQLSLEEADKYLTAMIAQGYHSPIRRFSELRS